MSGITNQTGANSGVVGTTVGTTGGGLVHVKTANMPGSDSSGSIFATFNDGTYNAFHVVMKDIELASDSIEWRMKFTDAGGGAESGNAYWTSLQGYTSGGGSYNLALQPATYMRICPNEGNATGEVFNGMFTLSGMRNTAVFATITGTIGWNHGSNYIVGATFHGQYNGNAATQFHGFVLDTQSGNFAGGSISVYGYTTS